jgi:hypothetical protein
MTEELRDRLARLDPMRSGVPTSPTTDASSRELLENIMSTPLKERIEPTPAPKRTWGFAFAALAALVLAVAGGIAFLGGEETPPAAALELNAGGEDIMQSCIAFSAEELDKVAELAFAGTVTAVDGATVTLAVDEWFRGGDAAEVVLIAPQGMEALIGGIPFTVGDEYLISAQGGSVNYCGFSGAATADYRAAFEEAFAQG